MTKSTFPVNGGAMPKIDRSAVMRRAWAIFRETYKYPLIKFSDIGRNCFAWALKQSWNEARQAARTAAMSAEAKAERVDALHALIQQADYIDGPTWRTTVQGYQNEGEREKASPIIKAAVTYAAGQAAYVGGFDADHTGDWVFAGAGDIIGGKHLGAAQRSLHQLTKLMKRDDGSLMTIELWSVASVAGLLLKQTEDAGLIAEELEFLRSFAQLVGRLCDQQYRREVEALQSH